MSVDRDQIEQVLNRLASGPGRFAALLSRLEAADAVASAPEGELSPTEVLAHVRAANDILQPRIFYVLVRDNPPLIAYDETVWREVAHYDTLPLTDSLQTMRLTRNELVRALRALRPSDWERTGNHEVKGPMSVLDIALYIANHEDEQIAQIERFIG